VDDLYMKFSERGGSEVSRASLPSWTEASLVSHIETVPSRADASPVSHIVRVPSRADASPVSHIVRVPSRADASPVSHIVRVPSRPEARLVIPERSMPDLGKIPVSPARIIHELPEPGLRELPKGPSESTGQVESFVGRTLQAFGQVLLRAAMHVVGLGPVYEVCHWAIKVTNAVEALLSDHGVELSLPVPVGGVDLMVSVTVGDSENGEHRGPVTMFVAPGEDSFAAAVEIGPAEQGEHATHPLGAKEVAAKPSEPVAAAAPVTEEHVQVYGEVAVATIDLSALEHRSRADRVAVLRELAERELGPRLTKGRDNEGLALVIGYDPAMGLAFWIRTDPDSSRVWRVVAEYDPATGRLVIKQATPNASSGCAAATDLSRSRRPRIILRKT